MGTTARPQASALRGPHGTEPAFPEPTGPLERMSARH